MDKKSHGTSQARGRHSAGLTDLQQRKRSIQGLLEQVKIAEADLQTMESSTFFLEVNWATS